MASTESESKEEILAGFEELFAKRYTEEDVDYMKAVNSKTIASPPCIENWLSGGYSRGGHRDDRRDHGGSGGRYGDNRYHPYQRDDRHGGGRYGDRSGDRHGSDRYGNRPQDNRRDDRRRHDNRDNRSRKPTDYGSDGFYQFYY